MQVRPGREREARAWWNPNFEGTALMLQKERQGRADGEVRRRG